MRCNFKLARKQLNLTLEQVGEKVGVSKQMICDIEQGRRSPSWKLQQRLVQFFNIPAEKLLATTDTNSNQHSNTINNDKQLLGGRKNE